MPREVSEKTLELDLCAELIAVVRARTGAGRAFWIGMTQDEEAGNGIDSLLDNVPDWYYLALQFKSPYPSRPDAVPYRFTINQTQHALLMNLANKKPDAVFYVLPHYNTLARVGANSPNLLANTIFYPVVAIGPLAAPLRHRVDSSEAPGYRVVIHSDEREGVGRLGSALAGRDFWEQRRDSWLTRQQLRNSFDWLLEHQPKRRVRGQILRGFRLLAVPA